MSPMPQQHGGKVSAPSNLYTAILALAVGVILATAAYVTYACHSRYETIFGLP